MTKKKTVMKNAWTNTKKTEDTENMINNTNMQMQYTQPTYGNNTENNTMKMKKNNTKNMKHNNNNNSNNMKTTQHNMKTKSMMMRKNTDPNNINIHKTNEIYEDGEEE